MALSAPPFTADAQPGVADSPHPKRKIGIIGSGTVGSTLGRIWAAAGHDVMFSARNVDTVRREFADLGDKVRYGTPDEAAAFGDIVLLAVPYTSVVDVTTRHAAALKGKIVIDAMNLWTRADQAMRPLVERETGGNMALFVAKRLPGARVVRTFSATDMSQVQRSYRRGGKDPLVMPLASDDSEAAAIVSQLVDDTRTQVLNVGGLAEAVRFQPGAAWTLHTTDMGEARQAMGL